MRANVTALSWATLGVQLAGRRERLVLTATDDGLRAVGFEPPAGAPRADPPEARRDDDHPVLVAAREQLAAYFTGARETFDLPLAPVGSAFRQQVWALLRDIPYGTTTTYGALAAALGRTGRAARAVGLANGANPLGVVVPCHRVVGADGRLTGYAGGIERKRALLALERSALC